MQNSGTKAIAPETLSLFISALFRKAGMPETDAECCAQNLLQADLWGISSHGVIRAPLYLDRLAKGGINPRPDIRIAEGGKAVLVLDADGAAGCVAGRAAMEKAVELAREYNIAAVGVRNSNHFGAAGIYSKIAADEGMIGICMTNVTRLVAGEGSDGAVVGNNPLSVAIPAFGEEPFLLDMALSRVANGKLILAEKKGEKIPFGWALDRQGKPTDDPVEAQKGSLLPIGDYKGLILAYAVDILSGLITGSGFADTVVSMYQRHDLPSRVGHLMLAINIAGIIPPELMRERMAHYFNYVRGFPVISGKPGLMIPGEREFACEKRRRAQGVPVPLATLEELAGCARLLGVAVPEDVKI
ncbi:MAG: Ldh family oxidoreductase [Oscillospiraceae bacterium]|jgi:LDH2 family malate/lactate/ureidoglycolate dehydrogenase|nr:Ldh family oxidoreductase [Oscillospiraceae bacterium]